MMIVNDTVVPMTRYVMKPRQDYSLPKFTLIFAFTVTSSDRKVTWLELDCVFMSNDLMKKHSPCHHLAVFQSAIEES